MEEKIKNILRGKLLAERDRLNNLVRDIGDDGLNRSLSASTGELSIYDNHPADIGSEVFERSKDFSLRENARLTLREVEEALESMENGTYGICRECGRKIPVERMMAVPYASKCIDCKKKAEEKNIQGVRPVEEEVLDEHIGHSFEEDAWVELEMTTEHAEKSSSGSYYGGNAMVEDDSSYIESVENIPYLVGDDGMFYQDLSSSGRSKRQHVED